MNTIDAPAIARPLTAASPEDITQARAVGRLVVVVPDVGEPALLASRIHQMAQARRQDVLMIGVASQFLSEAELRRKLTPLAAFLQDAGTMVQIRVERGLDWIPGFQSLLGDNDLLACRVDEDLPAAWERGMELLATRLGRPVYTITDCGSPSPHRPRLAARLAPWLGSIAIILGFAWLQIGLGQRGDDPVTMAWLLLSVVVEVGLIWFCNALLG